MFVAIAKQKLCGRPWPSPWLFEKYCGARAGKPVTRGCDSQQQLLRNFHHDRRCGWDFTSWHSRNLVRAQSSVKHSDNSRGFRIADRTLLAKQNSLTSWARSGIPVSRSTWYSRGPVSTPDGPSSWNDVARASTISFALGVGVKVI
jgi:hypothetical protein